MRRSLRDVRIPLPRTSSALGGAAFGKKEAPPWPSAPLHVSLKSILFLSSLKSALNLHVAVTESRTYGRWCALRWWTISPNMNRAKKCFFFFFFCTPPPIFLALLLHKLPYQHHIYLNVSYRDRGLLYRATKAGCRSVMDVLSKQLHFREVLYIKVAFVLQKKKEKKSYCS